jgi:DNA-directed RNA polymerase sigma subunit (sigma70/sigma32)
MENDAAVDPVTMYLRELSTVAPLRKDEELQLFRKLDGSGNWNDEQENAARRLIETHLHLVVSVAKNHLSSGISMLDLIQEGNLGLLGAVRSFAERPWGEFDSYATNRIEKSMKDAVRKRQLPSAGASS